MRKKKMGIYNFKSLKIVGDPFKGVPLMGEGLIRSQLQHPNITIKHLNPELGFQFQLQKDIPKYITTTNLTCSTGKTKVFTIPNQKKAI
jgi:hypothetical protein